MDVSTTIATATEASITEAASVTTSVTEAASVIASTSITSLPTLILDGSICTQAQRQISASLHHCLTRGESMGLTVVFIAAFLSLLAVLYFFTQVFFNYIRRDPGERLIKYPMDVFMLSLASANLLGAVAALLNGKWLHNGIVQVGVHCTAQGVLLGTSATAIALNTTLIALHTFITLFWSSGMSSLVVPVASVIFVWLLTWILTLAFAVANRNIHPPFYAPTPDWCWIRSPFIGYQLAAEYIWLWIALGVALCTYVPLHLWLRRRGGADERNAKVARVMLLYPAVFCILIIPLSVARWIRFASRGTSHIPPAATLAADALFHLSGLADIIIFYLTRQGLLLFKARASDYVDIFAEEDARMNALERMEELQRDRGADGRAGARMGNGVGRRGRMGGGGILPDGHIPPQIGGNEGRLPSEGHESEEDMEDSEEGPPAQEYARQEHARRR